MNTWHLQLPLTIKLKLKQNFALGMTVRLISVVLVPTADSSSETVFSGFKKEDNKNQNEVYQFKSSFLVNHKVYILREQC